MTVKEFLTISSIATEPEVIRTKLDELKKPYQLGQYKTPDTLNDINMGELMQLQSIETEHDILFVPCTVLMGLSKRYISQLPATDVLGFVQWVAKEVERINKLFASTNVPPTPEEKQAGSELLNFGPFGMIDYYAQRMGITDHAEVDSVPWVRVYKCLDMDAKRVRFERRLRNIYNPQIQISAESETKRSIFREKDKTKRSKKESAQHSKSRNKSFVMTSVSAL